MLPVLYADEALLVINKPAGLPTLPDGYAPDAPCVISTLRAEYGALWVVHRLDRETSGVLVVARTAAAHRALNAQFEAHTVRKVYHALTHGAPTWDTWHAQFPLRANGDRRHRTVVDPRHGKPARTRLRVLARAPAYAWLEATPETGRTHQIRVHCAVLGYPLVGDTLYSTWHARGSAAPDLPPPPTLTNPAPIARLGLHAHTLTLTHPLTLAPLTLSAPYPDDFATALTRLGFV